jgi:hypothetical protein
MPSTDVNFSVAAIYCPVCGSKKFTIDKRLNLAITVTCKGKKEYVYIPALVKHIYVPIHCPWGITLSKGDIVRAAIAKGDEDAKRRSAGETARKLRNARQAALKRARDKEEAILFRQSGS